MGIVNPERVVTLADGRRVGLRLDLAAFRAAERASGCNYFLADSWYTPNGVGSLFAAAARRWWELHGPAEGLVPVESMEDAEALFVGSVQVVSMEIQVLWAEAMGPAEPGGERADAGEVADPTGAATGGP